MMTYKTVAGTVTLPGSDIGVRAKLRAIPLTTNAALTFDGDNRITVGPVVAETSSAGVVSSAFKVPTNVDIAELYWRIEAELVDNLPGAPKKWTVKSAVEITGTGTVQLRDLVEIDTTAVDAAILVNLSELVEAAEEAAAEATTAVGTIGTAVTDAQAAATAASGSASTASTAATTATTKASEASTSAGTATTKATEATTAAGTATTKAGEASTSATAAATARTAAETARDTAQGHATTATTKAGEAATSATTASGHATTATTKAGEASSSASTAQTAATTATNNANGFDIGTVTTGSAGSGASATITGTAPNRKLNLTIPTGSGGPAGRGVTSIARTSGTGAPGTTDTYTITYSDSTTSTFTVTNGANGSGSGDVSGPASATVDNIATFNATTGKLVKDGGATIAGVRDRSTHTGTQAQSTITNLTTDLAAKAPLASPAFTGTPTGITKTHVGLGNVDNTSDASKPVSTAQQAALDAKAPLASPAFTGTPTGITKAHVGLGNVDNTADSAKPVSAAQQTALDGKVPTTRTVSAGTGLTGGGDLSANRSLAVAYGTTTGTVAAGDDFRITGAVQKASNLSDLASASTARTNLGLGTAATVNTGTSSGNVPVLNASGRLDIARLASGTPDGTKFVRDDGTLATPGGGVTSGTLIARTSYNPASGSLVSTTSSTPVDADATNLVVTFTAPSSGRVQVVLQAVHLLGDAGFWALRSGSTTVTGSWMPLSWSAVAGSQTRRVGCVLTGLTPGTSYTYKWAYGVWSAAGHSIYFGGGNLTNNPGPATMEVFAQ